MNRYGPLLALAAGLLVACSAEPSDQDISAALQETLSQAKVGMGPVADALSPTITNVKKIGCARSERGGYLCDVEFDVSGGLVAGTQHLVNSSRFVRSSRGWSVLMQTSQR